MSKNLIQDKFNLHSKTVLITGSGGLLGPMFAEALLEVGAEVIMTDHHYDKVKEKAEKLEEKAGFYRTRVYHQKMDVTNKEHIETVVNGFDKIDILINCAAKDPKIKKGEDLGSQMRLETMGLDFFKDSYDAAINGTFLCSQIVGNKMIKQKNGVIVNIASDLGVIAPDQRIYKKDGDTEETQNVKPIFYSTCKWAIVGMTKYLATYPTFLKNNIRVNCLSPTGVFNNHPKEFVKKLSSIIPIGRMANLDEYKGAIVFLCSDASSYMNGENLVIDGGKSVW